MYAMPPVRRITTTTSRKAVGSAGMLVCSLTPRVQSARSIVCYIFFPSPRRVSPPLNSRFVT